MGGAGFISSSHDDVIFVDCGETTTDKEDMEVSIERTQLLVKLLAPAARRILQ